MDKKNSVTAIRDHYRQADLEDAVRNFFDRSDRKAGDYSDTETFDEFHIRGRTATRELALLAELKEGMRVLDLGCGIGGPARMLAAEFGCVVTGVDLVDEYCRAASMITNRAGLSHMIEFRQGDMTDLDFADASFDAAWTLHTIMNIEDKPKLFDSVFRILKPGGRFALYEICAGAVSPPYFPVPWASDADMSFLLEPKALRRALAAAGFIEDQWQDVSSASIKWFHSIAAARKQSDMPEGEHKEGAKEKQPGISLLLGKTAAEKSRNVFRNLSEDRIRTVFGIYRKPEN